MVYQIQNSSLIVLLALSHPNLIQTNCIRLFFLVWSVLNVECSLVNERCRMFTVNNVRKSWLWLDTLLKTLKYCTDKSNSSNKRLNVVSYLHLCTAYTCCCYISFVYKLTLEYPHICCAIIALYTIICIFSTKTPLVYPEPGENWEHAVQTLAKGARRHSLTL